MFIACGMADALSETFLRKIYEGPIIIIITAASMPFVFLMS